MLYPLSMSAIGMQASRRTGKKEYESGMITADRYTTSNVIHQYLKFKETQWNEYLNWLFHYEYELLGIPEPSEAIYLRAAPEVSQSLRRSLP